MPKCRPSQFDLLQALLIQGTGSTEVKMKVKDCRNHFKPIKLADTIIVEECEEKFQDYFIKQKRKDSNFDTQKRPINKENVERSLNGEMKELHQEMIIEEEENVAPYPVKGETYLEKEKLCRNQGKERRKVSDVEKIIKPRPLMSVLISSLKPLIGNWLKPGTVFS